MNKAGEKRDKVPLLTSAKELNISIYGSRKLADSGIDDKDITWKTFCEVCIDILLVCEKVNFLLLKSITVFNRDIYRACPCEFGM